MHRLFPKKGTGRITEQMPQVLQAGLEPALFRTIVHGRLHGSLSPDIYCGSGSCILYGTNGDVKVGLDERTHKALWGLIRPDTPRYNGGIIISAEFYENAKCALRLTRQDLRNYDRRVYESTARDCEFFKAMIPDKELRESFISDAFRHTKDRYGESTALAVYFAEAHHNPIGRLLCVGKRSNHSFIFCNYGLDTNAGLLVAVGNGTQSMHGLDTLLMKEPRVRDEPDLRRAALYTTSAK